MQGSATQFAVPAARTMAAALLATLALASPAPAAMLAATAETRPAHGLVAQAAPAPAEPAPSAAAGPAPAAKARRSQVDRVEARITRLHATLTITSAQEELWAAVTQVMRDNAQTMEALTKARADQAKTMSAVDDLKSYAELAAAHAAGLQKFVPAFEALYVSMSDAQKANANRLFQGHGRRPAAKKPSKNDAGASPTPATK